MHKYSVGNEPSTYSYHNFYAAFKVHPTKPNSLGQFDYCMFWASSTVVLGYRPEEKDISNFQLLIPKLKSIFPLRSCRMMRQV